MVYIVLFCRAPEDSKVADGKKSLQQSLKLNTPVLRAHVDYSANSGPRRLKDIMKDEAEQLCKTPYGILQVWVTQPLLLLQVLALLSYRFQSCSCNLTCQPDSPPAGAIYTAVQQAESP